MANYMAEVAKMLGVELGEEFKVVQNNGVVNNCDYYFTEDGMYKVRLRRIYTFKFDFRRLYY